MMDPCPEGSSPQGVAEGTTLQHAHPERSPQASRQVGKKKLLGNTEPAHGSGTLRLSPAPRRPRTRHPISTFPLSSIFRARSLSGRACVCSLQCWRISLPRACAQRGIDTCTLLLRNYGGACVCAQKAVTTEMHFGPNENGRRFSFIYVLL